MVPGKERRRITRGAAEAARTAGLVGTGLQGAGGPRAGTPPPPVRLGASEHRLERCRYDGAEVLLFRADDLRGAMAAH